MKPLFTSLLLLCLLSGVYASDCVVNEGVTWFDVESVSGSTNVQNLFADQLPGGDSFANASRLFTADSDSTLAAWYDGSTGQWRGTLQTLEIGQYWLVLPPMAPESELSLPGVTIHAGSVATDWGSNGWMIRPSAGGGLSVSPTEPPKSSATYRVQEKADSTWKASSGVYILGEPQLPSETYIWLDLAPVSSGYGAKHAAVPLPPGGRVTVPFIPNFSAPPWGDKKVD